MKTVIESNERYHSNKRYIGSSGLKAIHKKSVYHYINELPFSSKSLNIGTMIHTSVLEPHNFEKDYYVMPKVDKRTTAGKESFAAHTKLSEGREVIDEPTKYMNDAIVDNFLANSQAVMYTKGAIELSHYSEINGVMVKVRPDCVNMAEGFMSDPKTCQDNSPAAFKRDIFKYGYHIQATFYSDVVGIDPKNFVFIAIETNHPYSVQCYSLGDAMIEMGREDYMAALDKWKEYLDTGVVNSYEGYEKNDNGLIVL